MATKKLAVTVTKKPVTMATKKPGNAPMPKVKKFATGGFVPGLKAFGEDVKRMTSGEPAAPKVTPAKDGQQMRKKSTGLR